MTVYRPSTGKQTGDPTSHGYNAYDFNTNILTPFDCTVIQSKDGETRTWLAFTANDPYKNTRNGKLLTEDYGNYFKARGLECDWLVAHLPNGKVPKVGTRLLRSQLISVVGNTGNSTGPHGHHEFRLSNNFKIEVDFETGAPAPTPPPRGGEIVITDQTRIPQIENKEVQAIRSELQATHSRVQELDREVAVQRDKANKHSEFFNPIAKSLHHLALKLEGRD